MNEIGFLAEWALRSSILIACGALLIWLARIKDPAIRLAGWIALLLGSLLIPAMTMTLPVVPVRVLRVAPRPPDPAGVVQVDFTASVPSAPQTAAPEPPRFNWYGAGLTLYAIVASALLLRLCIGLFLSWWILRRSRRTARNFYASTDIASPATLGILRPLVVLPQDWPEWETAKLDSVLAHERSHIQRYDPAVQFLSAIHRALLWFSPAAWFLHSKIVRAGEEVSDDDAIGVTGDRPAYAGMLVDFMRRRALVPRHFEVPMARYGSADRRIQRILDSSALSRGVRRPGFAGILVITSLLAYFTATAAPAPVVFEVASIKPALNPPASTPRYCPIRCDGRLSVNGSRVDIRNMSLYRLIVTAYGVEKYQVSGPKWMDSAIFDIAAKIPASVSENEVPELLQSLLAVRFRLSIHRNSRDLPVYGLVTVRSGSKLQKSTGEDIALPDTPRSENLYTTQGEARWDPQGGISVRGGPLGNQRTLIAKDGSRQIELSGVTMGAIARWLTQTMDRPVIDMTNLAGKYRLAYDIPSSADPQFSMVASVLNSLEEAGLKLEHRAAPIEMIVVDHLEKVPTRN